MELADPLAGWRDSALDRSLESNLQRPRLAVIVLQMPISFHAQCAVVLISKPARNFFLTCRPGALTGRFFNRPARCGLFVETSPQPFQSSVRNGLFHDLGEMQLQAKHRLRPGSGRENLN